MTAGELRQREKCKSKKRGSKRIILNICRVFPDIQKSKRAALQFICT